MKTRKKTQTFLLNYVKEKGVYIKTPIFNIFIALIQEIISFLKIHFGKFDSIEIPEMFVEATTEEVWRQIIKETMEELEKNKMSEILSFPLRKRTVG